MSFDGRQRLPARGSLLVSEASVRCAGADFEGLAIHLLESGYGLRFRARGSSMYPLVRDGDILDVRPIGNAPIGVGDIVLYRSSDKGIVVHRVVGVHRQGEKATLRIKGDAAGPADPRVLESQVLGRVVGIERLGRKFAPGGKLSRNLAALQRSLIPPGRWALTLLREALGGLRKMARAVGHGS
jgi:hypothetical protein